MIPEMIDMFDELPKTSTGKIDRVKLASEPAGAEEFQVSKVLRLEVKNSLKLGEEND